MIRILWFARLREDTGHSEVSLDGAPIAVGDLKGRLQQQYPQLSALDGVMVAVNEQYADDRTIVSEGDTVAFIPPVSGG